MLQKIISKMESNNSTKRPNTIFKHPSNIFIGTQWANFYLLIANFFAR